MLNNSNNNKNANKGHLKTTNFYEKLLEMQHIVLDMLVSHVLIFLYIILFLNFYGVYAHTTHIK